VRWINAMSLAASHSSVVIFVISLVGADVAPVL
jgi:hypothetical protein